jgi:hypothetical protein
LTENALPTVALWDAAEVMAAPWSTVKTSFCVADPTEFVAFNTTV